MGPSTARHRLLHILDYLLKIHVSLLGLHDPTPCIKYLYELDLCAAHPYIQYRSCQSYIHLYY